MFNCRGFSDRNHFNPRSREGSDISARKKQHRQIISIHAPAKGATFVGGVSLALILISIHAPAKGATLLGGGSVITLPFQSTLPRRERPLTARTVAVRAAFQSTLPRRERPRPPRRPANLWRFQSTLPRRERPRKWSAMRWRRNFNPRSREGSDNSIFEVHGTS